MQPEQTSCASAAAAMETFRVSDDVEQHNIVHHIGRTCVWVCVCVLCVYFGSCSEWSRRRRSGGSFEPTRPTQFGSLKFHACALHVHLCQWVCVLIHEFQSTASVSRNRHSTASNDVRFHFLQILTRTDADTFRVQS